MASSQQDEPQPPTTSTASAIGRTDAAWPAPPPMTGPAPPLTLAAAALVPVFTGSWIVPVNISRTAPTARTMTMRAATGANGRLNSTLAGTDSGVRGWILEAIPASPYQARALTRPVTAATPSAAAVPRCAMSPAATDSTRKLASSHSTARGGGSLRHQATITPPWLSAIAMPSMIGIAARNGQENGSTATPNASVTTGESSSQATEVSARQEKNARLTGGARSSCGQASRSSTVSIADLASSNARRGARTKPGLAVGQQPAQVVVGGERGEGRWPAARAAGRRARGAEHAASAAAPPAATRISPLCRRNPSAGSPMRML